jgi:glucose-6-phosphate dehydrogenase assembly protein OpcA
MSSVSDAIWEEQGTTPDAIEAALRDLLAERHSENGGLVPARALNMIVFVDGQYSGEIANRLRGVGRYHASRLVVLSYKPSQRQLDARVTIASEGDPKPGELALLRETVLVELGDRHLEELATIVDPLVVTDLPTVLWSPHGHPETLTPLLGFAQAVLLDSIDEPDYAIAIDRAHEISERAYVVDLAWLRSTPWRERIAATFDPAPMREQLGEISSVAITHHPDSQIAAMLLIGWLASRLHWQTGPLQSTDGRMSGTAHSSRQQVALSLKAAPEQQVRGLAGLALQMSSGRELRLDRGRGGLHAYRRDARGAEHEWTVLGASRGEVGILGEGIRQSLLRDPTYAPALAAAKTMVG